MQQEQSSKKWTETQKGTIKRIINEGGETLGYSIESGINILTVDGFAFKDLNKSGKLEKYKDWRLAAEERAVDLASKMSIDQIAGLMLYSAHQGIPNTFSFTKAQPTYNGDLLRQMQGC